MHTKYIRIGIAVLALAAAGAAAYGLYSIGMNRGMRMSSGSSPTVAGANAPAPSTERPVLYWHDPMVPGPRFDKPGKSPFMDMDLVPVYAEAASDTGVTISPRAQQNLGMRTAEVVRGALTPNIEATGSVAWNERDVEVVPARANGFVEKLHVRAPFDVVKKGQPLAELYVPDWLAAQEEFLSLRRMQGTDLAGLVDGARQRMRQAGMTADQIAHVETNGKLQSRVTVVAPSSGVITELGAREGAAVSMGTALFRINGLSTVWVNAEVSEGLAAQLRPGSEAQAVTPGGGVIKGKVSAILPEVNASTRTFKVRVELPNADKQLMPGMFATVGFKSAARPNALLVPSEALITTGERNLVMVMQEKGSFMPVEVERGIEANGLTEIRKGLTAGQRVVLSGQFLVDSEASLRGVLARHGAAPASGVTR